MIVVHHLEQSRSQRIVWLLEELGLPYDIVRYRRNPKTMLAPPELKAVHPLGKAPVVVDDSRVLIESGAIIDELISRHAPESGLRPPESTPERLAYSTFLHFAEGSQMPPLVLRLVFDRMGAMAPALLRPLVKAITAPVDKGFVEPNIRSQLDFLEGELGKRAWFAGDALTGADIQMSFPIERAAQRGGLDGRRVYAQRCLRSACAHCHTESSFRTAGTIAGLPGRLPRISGEPATLTSSSTSSTSRAAIASRTRCVPVLLAAMSLSAC